MQIGDPKTNPYQKTPTTQSSLIFSKAAPLPVTSFGLEALSIGYPKDKHTPHAVLHKPKLVPSMNAPKQFFKLKTF